MNFEGGRHCKIIRSIGVPLGLWPYRRTILGKMNGALAVTIILLSMVTQVAVFTTHEFSGDLFFKFMTGVVPFIVVIVKYFFFMLNMDQFRRFVGNRNRSLAQLLFFCYLFILLGGNASQRIIQVKYVFEWIQCDYDSLTNERELRFIEKFADRGTSIVMSILYCVTFIFLPLGFPFLSVLFNLGRSLNQSRSASIPINVEYFVDQDRCFYWIMFHIDVTTVLGISILFVTESTFVHFATHACGLLEIVGDRVERMLESSVPTALCDTTYLSMNGQLVATIKLHQRVLEYIANINTSLLPHYCILIAIGVVSLSINLCILARAMLLRKITAELLTAFSVVMIQFFYLGCGNYISQILLDKGDELFTNTYYARWHEAPLPVQKMLLYIRQRSMEPAGLEFGGLYTGSFEFFSKLVNASMSYFTVLYSTA